jgi:hypothetical protein
VRPIRSAAVSVPQTGLREQLRPVSLDQGEQLALERLRLAGQAADLRDLFARDPDASAGGHPPQSPLDSVELACLPKRAGLDRALELGTEVQQVPAQPVLDPGALPNQILSMVSEQPDLQRPLIEIRGGKAVHAVLDDRPRDGERVDLVRLARLALPAPRRAHPMRRHPHHPLAGRDQGLFEPP